MKAIKDELYKSILAADYSGSTEIVEKAVSSIGYDRTMGEVIEPVMKGIGTKWTTGEVSLAQGFVAGKIVENFIENFESKIDAPKKEKGTVILGNIEDDFHLLGRKLVGIFLKSNGWNVVDLGNDVPAEDFVEQAVINNAHIIAASAMMYSTAQNMKKIRQELKRRNLEGSIKVALGGAVFQANPDLVEKMGGDGTAENAITAVDLIARLYDEATGKNSDE